MNKLALIAIACLFASSAYAQTTAPTAPASCKEQATTKKLAGAALTSFTKKCEADATATCDTTAADKKLAGAAKTSFTKKCVSDAVGN
jgi:hypothetical protein